MKLERLLLRSGTRIGVNAIIKLQLGVVIDQIALPQSVAATGLETGAAKNAVRSDFPTRPVPAQTARQNRGAEIGETRVC